MAVTAHDRFARRVDIVVSKATEHGVDATSLASRRESVVQVSLATMTKFIAVLSRLSAKERTALTVRAASNWPIRDRDFVNTTGAIIRREPSFLGQEPSSLAILHKVLWDPTGKWITDNIRPREEHGELSEMIELARNRRWEKCALLDVGGVGIDGFAVLYAAWQQQQESRSVSRIRLGNTKPSRAVVTAMTTVSRSELPPVKGETEPTSLAEKASKAIGSGGNTTILVYRDGEPIQLGFDVAGFDTQDQLIAQLAASPERMVNHWVALHSLLTTGETVLATAQWDIGDHMARLGYSRRSISDRRCRDKVTREMEALLRMRIRIEKDGKEYFCGPLFSYGERGRIEKDEHGNRYDIPTSFDLTISPVLYEGVLPAIGARQKENWVPLPQDLPSKKPATVALGAVLASRFRSFCCSTKTNQSCIRLKGQNTLRLAGIPFQANDPGRAVAALEGALAELREGCLVDNWTWSGEGSVLHQVIEVHPHCDFLDVAQCRLERKALPPKQPADGAELRAWRKKRNLSQVEAAKRLGIESSRTILRAEKTPDKPLTPRFKAVPQDHWA